jgi:two-component system response regulator YesN
MIADVCMPEMSGITLAQKVRQNWPGCKIIMLTAYAEFDYAFESIKSNVTGYVLKTEDDERILETVRKAVRELDKEVKELQLLYEAQDKLCDSMGAIQKELVLSILSGGNNVREDIIRQFDRMHIGMDVHRPLLMLIGKIYGIHEKADIVERFDYICTIKKVIRHYLSRYFNCIQVEYQNDKIVILLQTKEVSSDLYDSDGDGKETLSDEYFITFVKGTLELVQQSCKENLNFSLSFIVSNTFLKIDRLHQRFQHMLQVIAYHGSYEKEVILTDAHLEGHINNKPAESGSEQVKNRIELNSLNLLTTYLEKGDRANFFEGLKKICQDLRNVNNLHDPVAQEIYYSVALMLLSYINSRKISDRVSLKTDIRNIFRIDEHYSWNEAIEYLYRLAGTIMDLHTQDMGNLSLNLVQFINGYIQNNIIGDVSLIKLSEITGYNPSYLSRLYKEIANETLNEYISKIRFNKAKELLESSNFNLNEIAIEIGLGSRTYFNRFIKKITGMSPQEYRDYLLSRSFAVLSESKHRIQK